jgi:hypothetical protein
LPKQLASEPDSYAPNERAPWATIKQLAGKIKQLAPALLAENSNLPYLRLKTKLTDFLRAALYPQDESLVIVAVNDTNQDAGIVEFSLAERQSTNVEMLFEDRTLKPERSGTWTDRFGPYAVHIYQVGESRKPWPRKPWPRPMVGAPSATPVDCTRPFLRRGASERPV